MRVEQRKWTQPEGWKSEAQPSLGETAQLVLVFGAAEVLRWAEPRAEIAGLYPNAHLVGCSTAGEIAGTDVQDDSVVTTAIEFEHTRVRCARTRIDEGGDSFAAGRELTAALSDSDLSHVLAISDGLRVNGSELVRGLIQELPPGVQVTGGLAADGERFTETLVLCDQDVEPGLIASVGLYGDRLKIGYGCLGGWDPFGPDRLITRSRGNVLYELDGRSALELYKRYLGAYAADLPASALLFPLSLRSPQGDGSVVRTVLSIDEDLQTMTFAGDLPEGHYARFMKANFERLIDGAVGAARASCEVMGETQADLALLISCIGRRMVLKQRTEEEIESVREVLGDRPVLTGFYSYGEICPSGSSIACELHNQTMTVTTMAEC